MECPAISERQRAIYRRFFRRGEVGDWRNDDYFCAEALDRWDAWIADNVRGTDIVIPGV